MFRGKQIKDESRRLSERGMLVTDEDGIVLEIGMFWVDRFYLKGNANLN